VIGTAPNLHNHPSWQVLVNQGEVRDFEVSFKLTATSRYAESEVYTLRLTNGLSTPTAVADSPTPTFTATPTLTASPSETPTAPFDPTATPTTADATATPVDEGCVGDCDDDRLVTVDEIVTGINIALGTVAVGECLGFDSNMDGLVTVDEIVSALRGALEGCA
jgi:hypothetical protein